MLFQTCMTFFLLWNIREDIMKNASNQNVLVTIDFHCIDKKIHNIFYAPLKIVMQVWVNSSVNDDRILIFVWTIPLI